MRPTLSPVVMRNSRLLYPGLPLTPGSSSFSERLRDTVPGRPWPSWKARELEMSGLGCASQSVNA